MTDIRFHSDRRDPRTDPEGSCVPARMTGHAAGGKIERLGRLRREATVTSKAHRTMAAKTMVAATVAIAALCWTPQDTQAAADLYDDFSSDLIDRTKWSSLEFVRRIDNGVLKSELRRFGSNGNNSLSFADPDAVSSFQADVTVTAVSNIDGLVQGGRWHVASNITLAYVVYEFEFEN